MSGISFDVSGSDKGLRDLFKKAIDDSIKFTSEMENVGKSTGKAFDVAPEKVKEFKRLLDDTAASVGVLVQKQIEAFNQLEGIRFSAETGTGYTDIANPDKEKIYSTEEVEKARAEFENINSTLSIQQGKLKELQEIYKQIPDEIKKSTSEIGTQQLPRIQDIIKSTETLKSKYMEASEAFAKGSKSESVDDKIQAYDRYLSVLKSVSSELKDIYVDALASESLNSSEAESMGNLLEEVNDELRIEKSNLSGITQAREEVSKKTTTYMTQIRQLKNDLQELAMTGKSETDEYKAKVAELERVGTAYNKVNKEAQLLTKAGSATLSGMAQGITGLAGAFSAGQGVMSLFVKDNEKLVSIQTKLQAAMAITIGLQQVTNTLHATSSFRIGIVNKVTAAWRKGQMLLNTQLGLSVALSKALMFGGIGILIAGVASLIYAYNKFGKESKEVKDRQAMFNQEILRTRSIIDTLKNDLDFNTRIAQAQGKSELEILKMRRASAKTQLKEAEELSDKLRAEIQKTSADKREKLQERLDESIKMEKEASDQLKRVNDDFSVYEVKSETDRQKKSKEAWEKKLKEDKDFAKKQVEIQKEINKELSDLQQQNIQDGINIDKEGLEKDIAQIKYNAKAKLDKLKETEKKWREAQGGNLTEEQTVTLSVAYENVAKEQKNQTDKTNKEFIDSEKKKHDDILNEFQSYQDKYLAEQEKFKKKREDLESLRTKENSPQIDRSLGELKYKEDESLNAINEEFAQREEAYQAWLNQITNLSLEQLISLLEEAKSKLSEIESTGSDGEVAAARAQIAQLDKAIKDTKRNITPGKRTIKEWGDLHRVLNTIKRSFDEIGDSVGGVAGDIIKTAGEIATSTMIMIDGIVTLANNSSTAMAGTATAASTAIQAVEKASVILAIVSAALQITMKIFDLLGGDNTTEKYEKAKEAYESYISILDKVIQKQLELAESLTGENARAAYQQAIDLIKEQSEAARVLGKQYLNSGASWKSRSKGYTEVKDMSAEGWADAAKALGMSIEQFKNLMGGRMDGLFDLTDSQLKELAENAHIFWSQLDDDTAKFANQIVDGVQSIADVIEQEIFDITLLDKDSLRKDFADMLSDMSLDAKDFSKQFEEYMRDAVINSMVKEMFAKQLDEWRKKLSDGLRDGDLSKDEYQKIKAEGQRLADEMKKQQEELAEMYGWGKTFNQEASRASFDAMTQDMGAELSGRFTALVEVGMVARDNIISLSDKVSEMINSGAERNSILREASMGISDITNLMIENNQHLYMIEKHAAKIDGVITRLDKIEKNTKES